MKTKFKLNIYFVQQLITADQLFIFATISQIGLVITHVATAITVLAFE